MATKAKAKAAAAEGAWQHHVLGEVTIGKTIWRAQGSTAPDGKHFAGVRKFAVKADGTEQVTNAGLSFMVDDQLVFNIDAVIAMLQKAAAITAAVSAVEKKMKASAAAKKGELLNKAKPSKISNAKVVAPTDSEARNFVLKSQTGKYLKQTHGKGASVKLVVTAKSETAIGFATVAEAREFRTTILGKRAPEFRIAKP
jgi:hypothetical protein